MPSLLRLSLAILIVSCLAPFARAAKDSTFQVGANLLSHGLNRETQQASGQTSFLGTTYYQLYFQTHFGVTSTLQFSPNLSYMPDFLLPRKTSDGSVTTSYVILGLPVLYRLNDSWDFGGGPAILWYTVKGSGGTTTMNNGTGTATFARPGQSSTSKTVGLTFGAGWNMSAGRLGADAMIEGLTNSQKRNYSLLFSATYDLWDWGSGGSSRPAPTRSRR